MKLLAISNNPHNASDPPTAGQDDATGHSAPVEVVRPWPVSPQRLADPLTVRMAALALSAADAIMVQHGIEDHRAGLSFLATLLWEVNKRRCILLFSKKRAFRFQRNCQSNIFDRCKKRKIYENYTINNTFLCLGVTAFRTYNPPLHWLQQNSATLIQEVTVTSNKAFSSNVLEFLSRKPVGLRSDEGTVQHLLA